MKPAPTPPAALRFARPVPAVTLFASLSATYDFAYEASALRTELDRLLAIRAGLEVSERELQDQARRAGVDPGWLRP